MKLTAFYSDSVFYFYLPLAFHCVINIPVIWRTHVRAFLVAVRLLYISYLVTNVGITWNLMWILIDEWFSLLLNIQFCLNFATMHMQCSTYHPLHRCAAMEIILGARKFENIGAIRNIDHLIYSKLITMDLSEIFISVKNNLGAAWVCCMNIYCH